MPWTEEDDKIIGGVTKKAPRTPWQRFKDSFLSGALHNPIGAEGVVRATTNLSSEELNKRERALSDKYYRRNAEDEEFFKDVDTFSPANIGKHAVDLIGNIIGGADPTYVIAPGRSALQRMGAQGAINAGVNAGGQVVEKKRGVRDEINPDEIALSGAGGLVLQGAGEIASRGRANRQLARGGDFSLEGAKEIGNKFGTVTSTVRSPAKNKAVGGVKNSYHLSGRAIDIARGKGVTHKQLERAYRRAGYNIIESLDEGDHSHFAFNFKGGKAKETKVAEVVDFPKRGMTHDKAWYEDDIKRQMDEDPSLTRDSFESYEDYAAWSARENGEFDALSNEINDISDRFFNDVEDEAFSNLPEGTEGKLGALRGLESDDPIERLQAAQDYLDLGGEIHPNILKKIQQDLDNLEEGEWRDLGWSEHEVKVAKLTRGISMSSDVVRDAPDEIKAIHDKMNRDITPSIEEAQKLSDWFHQRNVTKLPVEPRPEAGLDPMARFDEALNQADADYKAGKITHEQYLEASSLWDEAYNRMNKIGPGTDNPNVESFSRAKADREYADILKQREDFKAQDRKRLAKVEDNYWNARRILDTAKELQSRGERYPMTLSEWKELMDQADRRNTLRLMEENDMPADLIQAQKDLIEVMDEIEAILAKAEDGIVPEGPPKVKGKDLSGRGKGSVATTPVNDLRAPKEPRVKIKRDNPGGQWLEAQRRRADENYSERHPVTGAVTGYLPKKIMVNPEAIKDIPGARGEARGPGDHQYDTLLEDVNQRGYQDDGAILIGVNHRGEPYIIEGNTRAAVARAKGIKAIPAEVRYFAGGEDVPGRLSPDKLDSILAEEPNRNVPPPTPREPPMDNDGYSSGGPFGGNDRMDVVGELPIRGLAPAIISKGKIYTGKNLHNHWLIIDKYPEIEDFLEDAGGFVDSSGRYLTREQAIALNDTHAMAGFGFHHPELKKLYAKLENDNLPEEEFWDVHRQIEDIIEASTASVDSTQPMGPTWLDRDRPPSSPPLPPRPGKRRPPGFNTSGGPFSDGPTPPKDPYEGLDPEQKLIKAIKAARPVTSEQRKMAHAALSEKAKKLNRLQQQGGGMDSFRRQMKAMKGKIPEADYESIAKHFTEDDIRTLLDRINFSNSLMPFEKVNTQQALLKLLGAEGLKVPTQSELRNLSEIFSNDLVGALLNNRTLMQKFWHGVKSGLNLPRALMASFDLSAPFRQGVFLVGRKEFWKSFANMFKLVGSENASKALVAEIKGRPNYQLMKEAGLAITDPHTHFLMDREEDFMSDWAESKIAKKLLVGHGVAASNRAYSGFLNKMRADVFDDFVKKYEALGVDLKKDPKKLKDIARFVNAATGRGSLGMNGNRAAPFLNNLFFSPRLIASRVQMLNPVFYAKLDPVVRKEAVKQLLIFSGLATSVLTMASQAGFDVEVDPRSTDFGKIKVGNTRYDILGGFQQYIRLGSQVITGEAKTLKGKVKELKPGFGKETRYSKLLDFLRSKYSPVAAYAANALDGENVVGEEFDAVKNGYESFIPLFIQGLMDNIEEHGSVQGTIMSVPSVFGVGVQTFEPKKSKGKKEKSIEDEFKNKSSADLDKELGFN